MMVQCGGLSGGTVTIDALMMTWGVDFYYGYAGLGAIALAEEKIDEQEARRRQRVAPRESFETPATNAGSAVTGTTRTWPSFVR